MPEICNECGRITGYHYALCSQSITKSKKKGGNKMEDDKKYPDTVAGTKREAYDPWLHRSASMVCSTCMFFTLKSPPTIGRCRRHAPSMNGYPAVYSTDWCGDHKIDENRI